MNKVQVRYIESNTISNSRVNTRQDDFWCLQVSLEGNSSKGIESDISIFSDAWMRM
ncbi:hypothetical protein [Acidaminobacter sp. JC074]|uniref:hypothetical protein n=1 Tax=Acidaminobacter sp. JC074 TaxID=2530199 RepID=UPI001F0FAB7E|nr:hypothetical protein [Acidaminobacter sp. JC074]